eukprot:6720138-Pyramimonas_sp.AAC.1
MPLNMFAPKKEHVKVAMYDDATLAFHQSIIKTVDHKGYDMDIINLNHMHVFISLIVRPTCPTCCNLTSSFIGAKMLSDMIS